jgi:hypothetical protein
MWTLRKKKVEEGSKMRKLTLIITAISIALTAWGQTGLNARSMGLAGAYQQFASGAEVTRWNPANLGLPGAPKLTLDIPNFAIVIGNNSINLDVYNEYFSKEYFDAHEEGWDDAAKEQILDYFDGDFQGYNQFQVTPFGVSYAKFAFAINGFSYSDLRVPQNIIEIPFQGLSTDPIPIENVDGEVILGAEFALSTAKSFKKVQLPYVTDFSAGITFKYFYGLSYVKVADAEGTILSSNDSLILNGNYRLLIAAPSPISDKGKTGDGVGFDLGAAAKMGDKLTVGISLNNIVGTINFGEVEERQGSITWTDSTGINIAELDNFGDYLDSVAISTDTSFVTAEVVRYDLPKSLVLAANYKLNNLLSAEIDYQQGLNNTAGGTPTPRIAMGAEIRAIPILPLRFGFALGGLQGTTYATGLGLDFKFYKLDLGVAGERGLFNSSKGISFALSQRFTF